MINLMKIGDYQAVISFDPEIEMFRGEFVNINGGADFYADTVKSLTKEAQISLKVFLDSCKERGIEPKKNFSGKFNTRVKPELHSKATIKALSEGISLNQVVSNALEEYV